MAHPLTKFGIPLDPVAGRDVTIQPKLNYRFRVRFLKFGGLESTTYSFDAMQQVISVSRPSINFSTKKIGTYAGDVHLINKPQYENITIRFRDDMANTLNFAIGSQLQRQYDFKNGRYAVSSGSAKFVTIIETLDGMETMRAVDAFRLEGCLITNTNFGELIYTGGGVVETSITITFDTIGDFYSESTDIDNPLHFLWEVSTFANSYASLPQTPVKGDTEAGGILNKIKDKASNAINSIISR